MGEFTLHKKMTKGFLGRGQGLVKTYSWKLLVSGVVGGTKSLLQRETPVSVSGKALCLLV